jgi:hypothetical protein
VTILANVDTSVSPYYDRFDPTKNRTKVLFQPDRPLQQSELIEIQSIQEHSLKEIANAIFKDGDIQSGMSFSIDTLNQKITIDAGTVYLAGKIRTFAQQTVTFTGSGTEVIGIQLSQQVITSSDDNTLFDPTQNVPSYNSPGADRLQETVTLTYNDSTAPTIYTFTDGNLFVQPPRPAFSDITPTLAQRTYDEAGSYQVSGFKVWAEASQTANSVDIMVDKGVAYVLGYRIEKPTPTRITVPKAQSTRQVVAESSTYTSATLRVKIQSKYVRDVTQVLGNVASPPQVQISKGAAGGSDQIPSQYTNVIASTVTVWNNSKTYVKGTDYSVSETSGISYINWLVGGSQPTTGSTYYTTFQYTVQFTQGNDYQFSALDAASDGSGWDSYVDFNGLTGLKPVDGTSLLTTYDYYLARADSITLDKTGAFNVIQGQSDRVNVATAPSVNDPLVLQIGNTFLFPNSSVVNCFNNGVVRLSMADLQKLKNRIENLEYNQTIEALENQQIQTEDPLQLRGVFAEPCVDFSRMDQTLSSISMSFEDATMTLQINQPSDQMFAPSFLNSSAATSWGRIITAPYNEAAEIVQSSATETFNVNPYAVYNKMGVLKISPNADNWIDQSKIVVNQSVHETIDVNMWWRHGISMAQSNPQLASTLNQLQLDGNQKWDMGNVWTQDALIGRTGTITNVANSIRDTAIEYMRQKTISFTASNLLPNSTNLILSFAGVTVPITPTNGTVAGSVTGSVNASASGVASGTFEVPANVRCGTVEVILQNATNSAQTTYVANGTLQTDTEVIQKTYVTVNLHDPLAESFTFQEDRVVTSIDLYFASKDVSTNVIVQIRGMADGGFPNQTVYAETVLTPSLVNISSDASVKTNVKLDDPLMCKAGQTYVMVIITDSTQYTLHTATLGAKQHNGQVVTTQPYTTGVMFSSSNGQTWNTHQTTDLKFTVYTARFNPTATIQFSQMSNLDSDMMLLMATYLTPANTGCEWQIKAVAQQDVGNVSIDAVAWMPLANYVAQLTQNEIIGLAELQATFTTNKYISPMLALDNLLFVNFISETDGDYVSLNIDTTDAPYNHITMAYDASLPDSCTVTPYYSTDGGLTWVQVTDVPTLQTVDSDFTRYTFNHTASASSTFHQVKFKLHLHAPNRFNRPRVRRFTCLFKDV